MAAKKPNPYKITARKHGGNDEYSWAVFIAGRMFVNGLSKREVPHFKAVAEQSERMRLEGLAK